MQIDTSAFLRAHIAANTTKHQPISSAPSTVLNTFRCPASHASITLLHNATLGCEGDVTTSLTWTVDKKFVTDDPEAGQALELGISVLEFYIFGNRASHSLEQCRNISNTSTFQIRTSCSIWRASTAIRVDAASISQHF
jgi:hypothetical protein